MTTTSHEDGLRQNIERTREQLGHTVEALVQNVDVPARVRDTVQDAKETVQAKVEQVKQRLYKGTETLQGKADEATLQAKSLTHQALAQLPPPVAGRIGQLTDTMRQRPVPTAAVVLGVLVALLCLLRRTR